MSELLVEPATRRRTGFIADTVRLSCVDGPGNRFVVFFQGCDFDCIACHNPQTIPGNRWPEGHCPRHRTVDDLVQEIRGSMPFISGVTASGGEATRQAPFVRELFERIGTTPGLDQLTRFIDTNGGCSLDVWDDLGPVLDGAMVDLKCFDDDVHRKITGVGNARVLASIRRLAELDLLYEVRLLLIGGYNDDPMRLLRTASWLADVDPTMRVRIIGFRAHGTRPHDPPMGEPTNDQLDVAAELLRSVGDFDVCTVGPLTD